MHQADTLASQPPAFEHKLKVGQAVQPWPGPIYISFTIQPNTTAPALHATPCMHTALHAMHACMHACVKMLTLAPLLWFPDASNTPHVHCFANFSCKCHHHFDQFPVRSIRSAHVSNGYPCNLISHSSAVVGCCTRCVLFMLTFSVMAAWDAQSWQCTSGRLRRVSANSARQSYHQMRVVRGAWKWNALLAILVNSVIASS